MTSSNFGRPKEQFKKYNSKFLPTKSSIGENSLINSLIPFFKNQEYDDFWISVKSGNSKLERVSEKNLR